MAKSYSTKPIPPLVQFVVSFGLPLFILTKYSDEAHLGPAKALLLALAFPVVLEAYSVYKRRKLSMLSVFAVGGILVTGAISLLGLNEDWLAARRALPYLAVGLALLVSIWIKRPLLTWAAPRLLDMDSINAVVGERAAHAGLAKILQRAGYLFGGLFVVVAAATFVLTLVVITSPTDTAGFNQEYARLRVISLPVISLPLLLGAAGILLYMMSAIEKLTGLQAESLLKKKRESP